MPLPLAKRIGYPIIIKAAAGGGGRGMRVVMTRISPAQLAAVTRSEAKAAFGDDTVYMEKFLEHPRHVEMQVSATAMARPFISAIATAHCNAATRKWWKKPRPPTFRKTFVPKC
jgi:acetyl/propionyl-CoA carboxylase alpha subunit